MLLVSFATFSPVSDPVTGINPSTNDSSNQFLVMPCAVIAKNWRFAMLVHESIISENPSITCILAIIAPQVGGTDPQVVVNVNLSY